MISANITGGHQKASPFVIIKTTLQCIDFDIYFEREKCGQEESTHE
jgi:hypothetical protein